MLNYSEKSREEFLKLRFSDLVLIEECGLKLNEFILKNNLKTHLISGKTFKDTPFKGLYGRNPQLFKSIINNYDMKIYEYTTKFIQEGKRLTVATVETVQKNIDLDFHYIFKFAHLISVAHLRILCKALSCLDMFTQAINLIIKHFELLEGQRSKNHALIEDLEHKIKTSFEDNKLVNQTFNRELELYKETDRKILSKESRVLAILQDLISILRVSNELSKLFDGFLNFKFVSDHFLGKTREN